MLPFLSPRQAGFAQAVKEVLSLLNAAEGTVEPVVGSGENRAAPQEFVKRGASLSRITELAVDGCKHPRDYRETPDWPRPPQRRNRLPLGSTPTTAPPSPSPVYK